jgi:hypothetical protein
MFCILGLGKLGRQKNAAPALQKNKQFALLEGRCYDHNFVRFLTIFGEKIGVFSKPNVTINILHKLAFLSQTRQFFRRIFRRKYFKNHNIGPRVAHLRTSIHRAVPRSRRTWRRALWWTAAPPSWTWTRPAGVQGSTPTASSAWRSALPGPSRRPNLAGNGLFTPNQGCQIFHGTKWTQNAPNGHKISQMSVKYSEWQQNV